MLNTKMWPKCLDSLAKVADGEKKRKVSRFYEDTYIQHLPLGIHTLSTFLQTLLIFLELHGNHVRLFSDIILIIFQNGQFHFLKTAIFEERPFLKNRHLGKTAILYEKMVIFDEQPFYNKNRHFRKTAIFEIPHPLK